MGGVPTFAVVTPPAPIVALADARTYPGVPATAADAFVQDQIDAAIGFLDGPDGWLNRSLGAQTLQCTISPNCGLSLRRPEPITLMAGPVLGLVSITGLSGTDSFGSPIVLIEGDMLRICQPIGPTFGGPPAPIVAQYTAGSPAGVIAQIKPTILAIVAKLIAAAPNAGRDPSLRSESIPDTFSKSWDTSGQAGPFGSATLAPIAHLRRW